MEEFVKDLLSRFDFAYMLVVNLVTYLLIKAVDELNGDKVIPTWMKRTTAVIVGVLLAIVAILIGADNTLMLRVPLGHKALTLVQPEQFFRFGGAASLATFPVRSQGRDSTVPMPLQHIQQEQPR